MPTPPDEPGSTIDEILAEIRRQQARRGLHPDTVKVASAPVNPFDLRRPCGVASLDLATGGGLPAGGVSQIDGPEGVGKTMLLLHYFRRCQQIYGDQAAIAMALFQDPLDKEFARRLGVQLAYSNYEIKKERRWRKKRGLDPLAKKEIRMLKKQPGVFAFLRGDAERVLDDLVTLVESNAFQIIAIDAWGSLLHPRDRAKDLGERRVPAGEARLQGEFMRRLYSALSRPVDGRLNETSVICTAQVRATMGNQPHGRDWEPVSGHALKQGMLAEITLSPGARIVGDPGKPPVDKMVSWEVAKGKAGCHEGGMGEFVYYFDPPRIDTVSDLWGCATTTGVLSRAGANYQFEELEYAEDDFKRRMEDPSVFTRMEHAILKKAGMEIRWK